MFSSLLQMKSLLSDHLGFLNIIIDINILFMQFCGNRRQFASATKLKQQIFSAAGLSSSSPAEDYIKTHAQLLYSYTYTPQFPFPSPMFV